MAPVTPRNLPTVAVIAHGAKRLGGGLDELRRVLGRSGVPDPLWFEVTKSRKAPKRVREALRGGAELIFVWGGDGMVQRSADALAGSGVPLAILPAGTANLLATNLGVPRDIATAVAIGLHGARRPLDLGLVNGEHFAVMAGTGFDGFMMRDTDREMKDRVGRLAYVWTGLKHLGDPPVRTEIVVDGNLWFVGRSSCVLFGNVGTITGGLTAFESARPDDGRLDVGVVTADGRLQWSRVLGRMVAGRTSSSPLVRTTQGASFEVRLDRALPFELDGGDRKESDHLEVRVDPMALVVCVPRRTRA